MNVEAQVGYRRLPDPEIEAVKSILEALRAEGRHWIRGISTDDWRRLHYAATPRNARRAGVRQNVGPAVAELFEDHRAIRKYLAQEASGHSEEMQHYILVKGDRHCIEDRGMVLLRPVLKVDFNGTVLLNFHVWFHDVEPANGQNHLMFGFRLEAPEKGSVHDYFHAQPLRRFGAAGLCHGMSNRFPERFPTIPLHASDFVELCLNAVLIACGKDALRAILRGTGDPVVRSAANALWSKIFATDPHKDTPAES